VVDRRRRRPVVELEEVVVPGEVVRPVDVISFPIEFVGSEVGRLKHVDVDVDVGW